MSFDPRREDYQRLGLRFARTLNESDPFGAARAFSGFGRRFAQNRDALPQSDEDRAFHLVAEATDLIDYQLPFAADEACQPLLDTAGKLLDEALDLDPRCHDAVRMRAASECPDFESYYHFLEEGAERVRADCERARAQAASASSPGERSRLAADIAMRPYLRWVSTQTGKALICGRYRKTIDLAGRLLELDPSDASDVRFTAALAYAKLEDEQGLDALERRCGKVSQARPEKDAWMLLARIALAHGRRDFPEARRLVRQTIRTYPHAALTLSRQDELPDGVFSRLAVAPYSEDEMILAVSEGTVLLQEGRDPADRGSLGSWLAREPMVTRAAAGDSESTRLGTIAPDDEGAN